MLCSCINSPIHPPTYPSQHGCLHVKSPFKISPLLCLQLGMDSASSSPQQISPGEAKTEQGTLQTEMWEHVSSNQRDTYTPAYEWSVPPHCPKSPLSQSRSSYPAEGIKCYCEKKKQSLLV